MKQKASALLGIAGLLFLLGYGAAPAGAYSPPLAAMATNYTYSVTLNVWDPMRQSGSVLTEDYGYPAVVTLQQYAGLMAWVAKNESGSSYYVDCYTYDPPQGKFLGKGYGPFAAVSNLKVRDGVIAWVADGSVYVCTYDPEAPLVSPGASPWRSSSYAAANLNTLLLLDGVAAWTMGDIQISVGFCIYDPGYKIWIKAQTTVLNPNGPFTIASATVFIGGEMYGYEDGYWTPLEYTAPYGYFVAQPTRGKAPLWVWFTDMSIAQGIFWQLYFGDGNSNSYHSMYYTYQRGGIFTAYLSDHQPGPPHQATITVYPSGLPSLPLLLLD